MARETAAERNARLAAEREARIAAEREAYPARLMAALERVSNEYPLELKVRNGEFVVSNTESRYANDYVLAYEYNTNNQNVLVMLEDMLDGLEAEKAEARRIAEVKREAERKVRELLTEEERELLGL